MKILKVSVIIVLFCNCSQSFSNDTITQKNTIALSFSNTTIEDSYWRFQDNMIDLQFEYNHYIINFLQVGGYGGVDLHEEWSVERDSNSISQTFERYTYSLHYGLIGKLHILPLIFQKDIKWFDLYVSGKFGFVSLLTSKDENIIPERGHYFDYSLMGGSSIYLSKKFGLFIEAGYRNFKYYRGFNSRYGAVFRF